MAVAANRLFERPLRHVLRMGVFVILIAFAVFILYKPVLEAFRANPFLNGLIIGCLVFGIILAKFQVLRLFPEIRHINQLVQNQGQYLAPFPELFKPVATFIETRAKGRGEELPHTRQIIETLEARLDDRREMLRYLASLLVFLGLLGTFWGLIETVGSVGNVINSLRGGPESGVLFEELKSSLSAPLAGMGISFSSSLFGLAGSLILGFLDLQLGRAQDQFSRQLEDWLCAAPEVPALVIPPSLPRTALQETSHMQGIERLNQNIEYLIHNMRLEQQMIRDWVEAQAETQRELKETLKKLTEEKPL